MNRKKINRMLKRVNRYSKAYALDLISKSFIVVLIVSLMCSGFMNTLNNLGFIIAMSLLPTLLVLYSRGLSNGNTEKSRHILLQSKVPETYLKEVPEANDIVLAKCEDEYICKNSQEDGMYMVLGGSGSGKTSGFSAPLLLNLMNRNSNTTVFAIDVKSELISKFINRNRRDIKILDLDDRAAYGYDPLYMLNPSSTEQELYECFSSISMALIPMPANITDEFWILSARNLLTGLLIANYQAGVHCLVELTDKILSLSSKDIITDALKKAEIGTIAYKLLIQFDGLADDTMSGIYTQMTNGISLISTSAAVRFHLSQANKKRVSPLDLINGTNIFLNVREENLERYSTGGVLGLIISQTLNELCKRPENAEKKIIFLMEEAARFLGSDKSMASSILDKLKTLRSRRVSLIFLLQELSGLSTFSEKQIEDLMSNIGNIVVLSARSKTTQQLLVDAVGKFDQRKVSLSGNGYIAKATTSYERVNLIEPGDLQTLAQRKKVLLITTDFICEANRLRYYNDSYFAPIAENIKKINESIN